jgi:hypothetical protein
MHARRERRSFPVLLMERHNSCNLYVLYYVVCDYCKVTFRTPCFNLHPFILFFHTFIFSLLSFYSSAKTCFHPELILKQLILCTYDRTSRTSQNPLPSQDYTTENNAEIHKCLSGIQYCEPGFEKL